MATSREKSKGQHTSAELALAAWARFFTAHALLVEQVETMLAEAGLPQLAWYDVLWTLEERGGRLRLSELADHVLYTRSNVTRLVDRLENAGDQVTVVTNFPALPPGTTSVDVLFPGLDPMVGIDVAPAPDGAFRSGSLVPADISTWSHIWNRPQAGWSLVRWPTPVPADINPDRFRSRVDRIIR